jgi:aspartyl-tRNA(Asn)/glutamyl-tRNA(Gln) amidotransferase subunit A
LFIFHSIPSYQAALQDGKTTCVEAVEYYLDRIENSKQLNAFLSVYSTEALQSARALDGKRMAGGKTGRLHGVIIGLKDVICYKDHPVSASSAILANFISLYSATAVERLLEEEAIIIGRLNCDEFAMGSTNENSAYGNVLNALDNTRVPGGSSGGSAVAVQAGLCMVSLGSDTGGSVRQPADFCGIIGLKPSYGKISRYGLIAYASSFDQIGIFGNTVADIGIVLEVMGGRDEKDSTSVSAPFEYKPLTAASLREKKYRIAYLKDAFAHKGLDPEIYRSITDLIQSLSADGHFVKGIDFQYLDYIVPAYYVLTTAEASSNLSRFDGIRFGYRSGQENLNLTEFYSETRSNGFGKEVKRRILLGTFVLSAGYYDAYFSKAQQVRKLLFEHTKLIFKDFDILILPTSPSTAFKIGEKINDPISMYLADIYTVYANLVGIPGISVPLFLHTNGMPFGIQVMTSQFNELLLLQFTELLLQQYKSKENPHL